MIRSMTGYGRFQSTVDSMNINVVFMGTPDFAVPILDTYRVVLQLNLHLHF